MVLTKIPISPLGESLPPTILNPSDLWPTPFRNVIVITDGEELSNDSPSSSCLGLRSRARLFRFSFRYLSDLLTIQLQIQNESNYPPFTDIFRPIAQIRACVAAGGQIFRPETYLLSVSNNVEVFSKIQVELSPDEQLGLEQSATILLESDIDVEVLSLDIIIST